MTAYATRQPSLDELIRLARNARYAAAISRAGLPQTPAMKALIGE